MTYDEALDNLWVAVDQYENYYRREIDLGGLSPAKVALYQKKIRVMSAAFQVVKARQMSLFEIGCNE